MWSPYEETIYYLSVEIHVTDMDQERYKKIYTLKIYYLLVFLIVGTLALYAVIIVIYNTIV